MANILKFVESEVENEVGGTYELATKVNIQHVEKDEEWTTVYFSNNEKGEQFYMVLTEADYDALLERNLVGQPNEYDYKSAQHHISHCIKEYISNMGCGEEGCSTCEIGVALGGEDDERLKELDTAFDEGAKAVLEAIREVIDQQGKLTMVKLKEMYGGMLRE